MLRRLTLLLAVAALVVSACGGAPALTDPKEILTKSLQTLKDVKTLHLKADLSGQVNVPGFGAEGGSSNLSLQGTTLEGDLDVAGKKARVNLAVPAMLGFTADAVIVDQTLYYKLGGLLGGGSDKYQTQTVSGDDVTDLASDPQKAIDELTSYLDKPGVSPTKQPDEKCGDKDCYRVSLTLDPSELQDALSSAAPGVSASGTVSLWVQKNDLRPVKFTIGADAGDQGTFELTIELSRFDAGVSIEAPPADQVEGS